MEGIRQTKDCMKIRRGEYRIGRMKRVILILWMGFSFHAASEERPAAAKLDLDSAREALAIKPARNPVKSISPVVRRSYERRAGKGIELVYREDGGVEERPYVMLPILFVVNSAELLDGVSRENAVRMAELVSELVSGQNARFVIQGHTSAEGGREANQALSALRAERIRGILTERGVPESAVGVLGLGASCARFPADAPEKELQTDRRVLIVRMQ